MARERISLIPEEMKQQLSLEQRIINGDINPDNIQILSVEEQKQVGEVLFKIASEKVEPNQGTSALEFILFAFMRIMMKKVNGQALTSEDRQIEQELNNIINMHELSSGKVARSNWLFDYMGYAQLKANEFLRNREEHIERKKKVMGNV
jgi:hypothetical protein